jgi:uncharacterized membrane protein YhaH (DUF805 family)
MSPRQAVARVWRLHWTFSGRASRSEFWWWWLITSAVALALQLVLPVLAGTAGPLTLVTGPFGPGFMAQVPLFSNSVGTVGDDPLWATAPAALWMLLTLLPSVAVASRRLHDANFSARWLFLLLVAPGGLVLLYLLARGSRPEGMRFDRPLDEPSRPALPVEAPGV